MAENSRFFFRADKIDNSEDAFTDLPSDLGWAVTPFKAPPVDRDAAGGMPNDTGGPGGSDYVNTGKIPTPVIVGIVKQEVTQDKEGKASIDVTFNIRHDYNDVEFELRITR